MGSDHKIRSLSIPTARIRRGLENVQITEWKKLTECPPPEGGIKNIQEWTQLIKDAHSSNTKTIQQTIEAPEVDRHLLHLWEARKGLTKRRKKRCLNRKLQLRIAEITQQAQAYAIQLSRQKWSEFCASLKGTLSTAQTWTISSEGAALCGRRG